MEPVVNNDASRFGARPHLLFLSHLLPYPPDGGASIRTYHLMRLLSRDYRITALCFFRRKIRPTRQAVRASVDGLREIAQPRAYPIPQEHSRLRFAWDHLRSIVRRQVYTRFVHDSAAFRRDLRDVIRDGGIDIIHLDSLDLGAYMPQLSVAPIVCGHHNVESLLLLRRAEAAKSTLPRFYLKYQAKLMAEEERRWAERSALNVVVSDADLATLERIAPRARFMVVPNGVDTTAFEPSNDQEAGIVFVGGYGWLPNRDALEHFCQHILPHVRRRHPTIQVAWVGRAPDDVRRWYKERYRIELTGYVKDIRPYVARAACYVVPIRVGGGTRLKILDAWAMGKAIVSTTAGCEGLAARDGENILIRNEPVAFADAIDQLLQDRTTRRRLGTNARRTAEARYDWEVIARPMLQAYRELVKPN